MRTGGRGEGRRNGEEGKEARGRGMRTGGEGAEEEEGRDGECRNTILG